MISFFLEQVESFGLDEDKTTDWIERVVVSESKSVGEINYIFCTDKYLLDINQQFLNHDTYTDIISFDNTLGNMLNGDIYISIERVKENAQIYNTTFVNELNRVLVHGVLHFCGYKDKTASEEELMRNKEDEKLLMFHVEH